MSSSTEETIKKLENRVSTLEKQIQEILRTLNTIQNDISIPPPSPGFDRSARQKLPRRR